jgi:hypothetical protein
VKSAPNVTTTEKTLEVRVPEVRLVTSRSVIVESSYFVKEYRKTGAEGCWFALLSDPLA